MNGKITDFRNTDSIRFDTIDRLANILDVPISELFEKIEDNSKAEQ